MPLYRGVLKLLRHIQQKYPSNSIIMRLAVAFASCVLEPILILYLLPSDIQESVSMSTLRFTHNSSYFGGINKFLCIYVYISLLLREYILRENRVMYLSGGKVYEISYPNTCISFETMGSDSFISISQHNAWLETCMVKA